MNKEDIIIKFKNSTSLTVEECIEKQIPKKPDLEGDGFDDNGMIIYDTWICPSCEEKYEVYYDEYYYCPSCGQRIDWSEDDWDDD